jgi:hypothetical protein
MNKELHLCITHKLELWKRKHGSAEAIAIMCPVAFSNKDCAICNGTWKVNQELSALICKQQEKAAIKL